MRAPYPLPLRLSLVVENSKIDQKRLRTYSNIGTCNAVEMAYHNTNGSLAITEEDSESSFDHIQTDFLQHFKNEIRISGLRNTAEKELVNGDVEKANSVGHEKESFDQISTDVVHKSQKVCRDSDVSSSVPQSDESKLFDAGGGGGGGGGGGDGGSHLSGCFASGTAAGTNSFVFGCMTISTAEKPDDCSSAINLTAGVKGRSTSKHGTIGKVFKKAKEPPLNTSFPSKFGSQELKILKQPEEQHRARYLTEGSRGTVKDQTGQGHPTVQLCGYDQPVPLQVFVGSDVGRMKPHGFYQACKVSNKNSTSCVERDIEGTTVIEIMFDPKQEMVAVVDCVGILKLRNADVELRIGLAKSKKKSTCARLIFRVNIPKPGGTFHTLQVASSPIICTQPTGAPEISKKSIGQCSVKGGEEMFIIGKNFTKGTVVYFEEVKNDQPIWSKEAEIDQDFFQATHLVCTVPSYRLLDIKRPVQVQIIVQSSGRTSDPVCFTYLPSVKAAALHHADASIPMETEPAVGAKSTVHEINGLKRPYDSSPNPDPGYHRSPGEMTNDVSRLMGHAVPAAVATEFCGVREEFTDSEIIQRRDSGQPLSAQPLFEAACVMPAMDPLAKSPVDSFILPLQTVDANPVPSVDSISCFQDSKENVPFTGVYDNLYDSSVAPTLVGEILSSHSQSDLDLTNQLTNMLEAAHQKMVHESVLQAKTRGRASLSEQIGVVQSSADHVAPLLNEVPAGPMECGELLSKPLASYQETGMDILMQLIQADCSGQKLKPKDEMNWSTVPGGNPSYNLNTDSNVTPLTCSESHSSCHGSNPGQLENLSNFALKTFESLQPNSSSVQTPPVLFNFDHGVLQSSYLHSPVAEVKPDPNFTGINDFLHGSIQYTNSSSPQCMDTSCPAGVFSDNSQVGMSFTVPPVDRKDDKTSLFGAHHPADSPKEHAAVGSFQNQGRSSLPGSPSDGNSVLVSSGNQVHMISIRSDSCGVVDMDFRNIEAMKTNCSDMRNILDTRLTSDTRAIQDMNIVTGQNVMLNHSGVNDSEIGILGVAQMSGPEHRLGHVKQALHGFPGQDQAQLNGQQLFTQSNHVQLTNSFSDGNRISDCIGMELRELDALMSLSAPGTTAVSSMTSLNDVQMPATRSLESVELTAGNRLAELDHDSSNSSHSTPVLGSVSSMNPLGNVVSPDSTQSTDSGSMQSNLQQSLSELHDLKQQMGFSEPQSPTRNGKMSVTQADIAITQENNLSPKLEIGIANEQPKLTTSDLVMMLLSKQDSVDSLSNCSAGNYQVSQISNIQAPLDCPQVTSAGQALHNTTAFDDAYYNLIQDLTSKGENLGVQLASSSNSSLDAELNGNVHHIPRSSVAVSRVSASGDNGYIENDGGISNDTKTLQQQIVHSLLNPSNSVPIAQPVHSQTTSVNVLLRMPDGKQVVVPLSSIMVSPSSTKPVMAVSNHTIAVSPDGSVNTTVTLMDYKPVVGTVVSSNKVICLPPNLVSALTGKLESGMSESPAKQVVVVPSGSINQSGSPMMQMTSEHLVSNISDRHSSSVGGVYSMGLTNGSPGNIQFVPNSTSLLPQSIDSALPAQSRQDHQPMDTSSSPFAHFAQGALGSTDVPQQPSCDQQRNDSSCKIPTLLYQLLTTDDNSRALQDAVTTATMTGLPNLSIDDVSRVLELNRIRQRLE